MDVTRKQPGGLADFPQVLRALVEAELAAGNAIVEIGSGHPAPPVGACLKLAKAVTTRARLSGNELVFHEHNSSLYSGEWTDARRCFFVLEPANPPPPETDMNALRDRLNASSVARPAPAEVRETLFDRLRPKPPVQRSGRVERFLQSMTIDYEKWHDGIGYDLDSIREATPDERAAIEEILLARRVQNWRDVEALAVLNTDKARHALSVAGIRGNHEVRAAVRAHAPETVPEALRREGLKAALREADFYGGLSEALREVERFHPPEIVAELFRGLLERSGAVAVHFAAMLTYLHGKATVPFDWEQRPFFLKFVEARQRPEREALVRELCARLEIDPEPHLR